MVENLNQISPGTPCGGQLPTESIPARALPGVRVFDSGATRDTEEGKPDYEGYLSPLVIERFGEYMTKHRFQSDGTLRDSDNWQKGIPFKVYMKSGWRHFLEWWRCHRQKPGPGYDYYAMEEALCALMFNVMGYLHELQKRKAL